MKTAALAVGNKIRQRILYAGVHFPAHGQIGPGIIWGGRRNISIGEGTNIERFCRIAGGTQGRVSIGRNCHIASSVVIRSFDGNIRIGDHVLLNYGCILLGNGGIDVGEDTKLAPYCVLAASNHRFDVPTIPIREQGCSSRGIRIGKDVWLGAHCTVLDGVQIGDGAVIGAGAVVTKDIPPFAVAVGVPASVVRYRK